MSTKHSKAAEKFLQDSKMAAWHNETLWMVRAKRDKMSKEVPEWEELRNKACELKLYSNSHLEELLLEFEKNATANGAIVHWAKDADEYCAIVYEILNEHNVHHFIKSKSMLAEECGLNPFLMERGIDVVESDLGERILQLMHLEPSHIVLPAIHIKREQVGELFEKEMGTEKGNFDPTYLTHAARKNLRHLFLNAEAAMTGANFAVASTGDIVVCTNEIEVEKLNELLERGKRNGVEGLQILDREELKALEPNISDEAVAALYAPTGGIVCPFGLTIAFAENAAQN